MKTRGFILMFAVLCLSSVRAQTPGPVNYDEQKVPQYRLPDVLTCADGTPVTSRRQWEHRRRGEVLQLLAEQEYGITPRGRVRMDCRVLRENPQALGGLATSQQVMLTFTGQGRSVQALLLAYYPNRRAGRVPVFIGYNFKGNHSLTDDEEILYSPYFERLPNREDPELRRNNQSSRWPLAMILRRGYAVVTMCYQDIFPDRPDGDKESVTQLLPPSADNDSRWQALGAWAWGYSRMADWVVRQPWANRRQLIVMGHSRQGKAALWAGAQDKRFQVVISNNSGCGGAALSKREFGERVYEITKSFPHWFCPAFTHYAGNEGSLPFDQHFLLALVAPRHLYVASAEKDRWADPKGEYLSAYHASRVFSLYGLQGLASPAMPPLNQPVATQVGYHIRNGGHDVTGYDWNCYMDFCDNAFGRE